MRKRTPLMWGLVLLVSGANPREDTMGEMREEELGKFQGKWVMTSLFLDGIKAEPASVQALDVTALIQGNRCVVTIGIFGMPGEEMTIQDITAAIQKNKCVIRFDPSKRPRALDVSDNRPGRRRERLYGIYRFDGDTLEIALKSDKRPANFVAREKDGCPIIIKMRRIKR